MYRLRFENMKQLFDGIENCEIVLPISEIYSYAKENNILPGIDSSCKLIAEIPAVLWEHSIKSTKEKLLFLKNLGLEDVLCENIAAVQIAKELDLKVHGGSYLNVLNCVSISEYEKLGAKDLTLSFEMPFSKMRALLSNPDKPNTRLGAIIYGYLPLMKFRACPAMGKEGCKGCTKDKYLKDRKGEQFRILCKNSEYSELLNCVPLYAADKNPPKLDFYTLYFTIESKEECKNLFNLVHEKKEPGFRRTAGLYGRELL